MRTRLEDRPDPEREGVAAQAKALRADPRYEKLLRWWRKETRVSGEFARVGTLAQATPEQALFHALGVQDGFDALDALADEAKEDIPAEEKDDG